MTIHRIIHRIWLDDPMPAEFARYGDRWGALHPGWQRREWTDSTDLPPLINREIFDRAREIMPRDWKRLQADLLRLELLWRFGGVYADTDVEPLRPFDDLLDRSVLVAWSPNKHQGRSVLTQAVLGAEQGSAFIRACIDAVPDSIRDYAGKPLAQVIGPHMIDRVYRSRDRDFKPLPSGMFYPQSNRDRDRGRSVDLGEAYCHHKWNNSLRKQGKGLG